MFTFLLVVTIVIFIALLLVTSMAPHRSTFSVYELERRTQEGDEAARRSLRQHHHADSIETLLFLKTSILLVVLSFLLVSLFGWVIGTLAIIVLFLVFRIIARSRVIHSVAAKLYNQLEPVLLTLIESNGWLRVIIRSNNNQHTSVHVGSLSELQHLIDQADDILSPEVKKRVVNSLAFNDKRVSHSMTPVALIVSLKKTEFLGPLTLDELHRSGHSRLPVIGNDINHIAGILHLDSLLSLDTKRSVTAEKAMDSHVHYIREDQTLPQALSALLSTHQHLFIVIDDARQTKGLITLDDIIEELIGHRLTDDFNEHESIRAVAQREISH